MTQVNKIDKFNLLYPRSRYYGQIKPKTLVFNANLQEFAQRVGYLSALETGGKISSEHTVNPIHDRR